MGRRDTAALDKFKTSGNGILFASGALWEGIEFPGDALSMLIIVKLLFAVPDPIVDYERILCPDMDDYKKLVLYACEAQTRFWETYPYGNRDWYLCHFGLPSKAGSLADRDSSWTRLESAGTLKHCLLGSIRFNIAGKNT